MILSLGAIALASLTGLTGVTKLRGLYHYSEEFGCYIVPALHPAAIARDPEGFSDFVRDVRKAIRLLEEPFEEEHPPTLRAVLTPHAVHLMCSDLRSSKGWIEIDVETTGLDPRKDKIVRVGISGDPNLAYIVYPIALTKESLAELKSFLEDDSLHFSAHNGRFDSSMILTNYGIDVRFKFDTMLAHYAVDERRGHGLKQLSAEYLRGRNYSSTLKKHLEETGSKSFGDVPDDILDEYLGWDLHYGLRLIDPLCKEMADEGVRDLHDKILIPADHALRDVELEGIKIDRKYFQSLAKEWKSDLEISRAEMGRDFEIPNFNPRSSKQVGELVYDKMRIPVDPRRGRTTDKEALEVFAAKYPELRRIVEYRQKASFLSKDVQGLLSRADENDRVHPDFLLHGTRTGRLSCTNPNLQNVPVLAGPTIRRGFIADEGWWFWECDYSQLELRIAAVISQDEEMIRMYKNGEDIHTLVASEIFQIPQEQVTYEQRYIAKYVDFGIFYGRGAQSLAEEELQCSVEDAQRYIDGFFNKFPRTIEMIDRLRRQVREDGFIRLVTGRKRRFPLLLPQNISDVEREAVNTTMQGNGHEMTLTSLSRITLELANKVDWLKVTSEVHDSILGEIRKDKLEEGARLIAEIMENVPRELLNTQIPFPVDFEYGESWGELRELHL